MYEWMNKQKDEWLDGCMNEWMTRSLITLLSLYKMRFLDCIRHFWLATTLITVVYSLLIEMWTVMSINHEIMNLCIACIVTKRSPGSKICYLFYLLLCRLNLKSEIHDDNRSWFKRSSSSINCSMNPIFGHIFRLSLTIFKASKRCIPFLDMR